MTGASGAPMAADTLATVVIVPTYNERENIVRLCRALLRQGRALQILVVDDNSPDGTAGAVRELAAGEPRVHLLSRPGKLGLGTAHVAGFRWALVRDCERVVTMDADFSHPPDRVSALIEASLHSDVVIGSRYAAGGGHSGWPAHRILLSALSNRVARAALRLPAADCTGAFRCFRRGVIERVALGNIVARGYSFQEEMLWQCTGRGWRIAEVPITFTDRVRGTSKISLGEVLGGVLTVLRLMFTPESRRRPRPAMRCRPAG